MFDLKTNPLVHISVVKHKTLMYQIIFVDIYFVRFNMRTILQISPFFRDVDF